MADRSRTRNGAGRSAHVSEVPRPDPETGRAPVCTVAFCPICLAVPSAEDLNLLGLGQTAMMRLSSRQGEQLQTVITGLPLVVSAAGSSGQDSSVHFALEDESVPLSLGDAATLLVTSVAVGARSVALIVRPHGATSALRLRAARATRRPSHRCSSR